MLLVAQVLTTVEQEASLQILNCGVPEPEIEISVVEAVKIPVIWGILD